MRLTHKHYVIGAVVLVVLGAAAAFVKQTPRGVSVSESGGIGLGAPSFVGAPVVMKRASVEEAAFDQAIAPAPPGLPYPEPYPTAGETAAEVDQKIIKNGYLRLVVDDVDSTAERVARLADDRGGFVQSSSVTERPDGTKEGSVTIRVPAEAFEDSMSEIKTLATLVRNENRTGQDVTEQYTDLQAQLRNAKAQEETYLTILRRAQTVEDILKVQERLGSIRSVIESLEGRLKYLANVTSYSTINVNLEEEPAVRAPTKEFRPGAVVKEAVQALVELAQGLVAGLIWIVIVGGGILLPLAVIVWVIVALIKRMRRKPGGR